jgi:hypothetical protein
VAYTLRTRGPMIPGLDRFLGCSAANRSALFLVVAHLATGMSGCGGSSGTDGVNDSLAGPGGAGSAGSAGVAGSSVGTGGTGGASGATSGMGGASSGTAGTGGSNPGADCEQGASFDIRVADGHDPAALCIGCQPVVTFTSSTGVTFDRGSCGDTTCESCRTGACASGQCRAQTFPADGTFITWSGRHYEQDSCGGGTACKRQSCAPAGTYTVNVCAPRTSSVNVSTCSADHLRPPVCTEVQFQLPSMEPVLVELRP